jgi:Double zinc ribbon
MAWRPDYSQERDLTPAPYRAPVSAPKPVQAKPGEGLHCVKCRLDVTDTALFCGHCGAALNQTGREVNAAACECGAKHAPSASFCHSCGRPLTKRS